jgi:hypothetical protein
MCGALVVVAPIVALNHGFGLHRTRAAIKPAAEEASTSTQVPTSSSAPPTTQTAPAETIGEENQKQGDPAWAPPNDPATWDKIRGFADHVSALQGDTVGLYVTTAAPAWHVEAYRMGWYGGAQARLIWASEDLAGTHQPDPVVDHTTGMRDDSNWQKSLDVVITPDWFPGIYMLKLVSSDGGQSMVPLTIRDDGSHAAMMVQMPVTTWQAYNAFGGANLYTGPRGSASDRSKVVTFDRPYGGDGAGEYFGREDRLVQQIESMGLDVTYTTDVDLHTHPELLLNHRVFVTGTHDEYWSLEMRNGVEGARDHGVNVVFMGANTSFRRIRLDNSPLGPYRHEVNYRVASQDPLNGKDPARVTTSWREPPNARPESSMIGDYYECNPVDASMVIVDPTFFLFAGTGVAASSVWLHAVGNEYDRVTPEVPTPGDIHVIAHSPVVCRNVHSFSDMTYYTATSGAGVLATGTFWLEPHMGGDGCPYGTDPTDCQIRAFLGNVFSQFALGPIGTTHPSVNNLAQLGIQSGYIHPTPP